MMREGIKEESFVFSRLDEIKLKGNLIFEKCLNRIRLPIL